MADKKISDFTEATTVDAGDWLEIENAAGNSRKIKAAILPAHSAARAYKTTSLTGLNFTTSTAITFDAEYYDRGSYHDTSSNTDRLTCAAAGEYDLEASVQLASINTSEFVRLSIVRYNSAAVIQETVTAQTTELSTVATGPRLNCCALGVTTAAGDFFRAFMHVESDTSIDFDYAKFAIRRVQ